jgi:GTP-binding protein Era
VTKSGFVAIIGRPNVGKSTLLNAIIGEKVTIVSSTPNTTRTSVRGILTEGDIQIVFVDTPGMHRPKTSLGKRMNDAATQAAGGVDLVLALVDAGAAIGPGDRQVLTTLLQSTHGDAVPVVVVNKADRAGAAGTAAQLLEVQQTVEELCRELDRARLIERVEYFPVSAKTGRGVPHLTEWLLARMPDGPFFFPEDEVSDVSESTWVAELVREQLFRKMREELPHSIHCRVTEFEWPHITVEILVERDSQKGMVIGKGGQILKDVGIAVNAQLPEGTFLELIVRVEPGWQRSDDALDRFGY